MITGSGSTSPKSRKLRRALGVCAVLLLVGCAPQGPSVHAALSGFDERAQQTCDALFAEPGGSLKSLVAARDSTLGAARVGVRGELLPMFDEAMGDLADSDYVALCQIEVEPIPGQAPEGIAIVVAAEGGVPNMFAAYW